MMKWACEWHNEEAHRVVSERPTECRIMYCARCRTRTWHATVAETAVAPEDK